MELEGGILMELENIVYNIKDIEKNIFDYNINNVMKDILSQVDLIYNLANKLNADAISRINNVLKYVTIALENKDYLLLADLLEYELKTILVTFDKE